MPGSGDPQSQELKFAITNVDSSMLATPVHKQFLLLACPQYGNVQLEVLAVDYVARVIAIDGTDPITGDVNFVDDSAADAETALVDDFNFKSTNTTLVAKVARNIYSGSQIMDPGDTLNFVVTSTTPDTASQGAALIVKYRVVKAGGGS